MISLTCFLYTTCLWGQCCSSLHIVLRGMLSFRADVRILRSLNITEMGQEPTSAPETSALKTGLLVSRACREHGLQGLFWPHCFWGRCYFWYHCQLRWQASWKSEARGDVRRIDKSWPGRTEGEEHPRKKK